jgi:hypothetical protein
MKSHKIHLSVAISRAAFTVENLGDEIMRDLRFGLFKSTTEVNQWNFGNAYAGTVTLLSPHQTITKGVHDFVHGSGESLDLEETEDLYVDCWVQDAHGIYLFNFFLES